MTKQRKEDNESNNISYVLRAVATPFFAAINFVMRVALGLGTLATVLASAVLGFAALAYFMPVTTGLTILAAPYIATVLGVGAVAFYAGKTILNVALKVGSALFSALAAIGAFLNQHLNPFGYSTIPAEKLAYGKDPAAAPITTSQDPAVKETSATPSLYETVTAWLPSFGANNTATGAPIVETQAARTDFDKKMFDQRNLKARN